MAFFLTFRPNLIRQYRLYVRTYKIRLYLIVQLKSGMVEDTSINEVEVREDNLIGTHEERVNEALLVVDTLEPPDECSLGSRMPGFIGQILLKPRIYTSSIYSCFLSHILEQEFCYLVCWAAKGSKGKFLK